MSTGRDDPPAEAGARDEDGRTPATADVEAEAAAWVIRLAAEDADAADRRAFEEWAAADPARRAAYERARTTWAALGRWGANRRAARGDARGPGAAPASRPRGRAGRRVLAVAAAACLFVASIGLWRAGESWTAFTADHRTAVGEVRRIALPDGSEMVLNTDSAADIAFADGRRTVTLRAGEALFAAAPAPEGDVPFTVETDGLRAEALGTRFVVRRDMGGPALQVLEHRVAVRSGPGKRVVLGPGEAVRLAGDGALRRVEAGATAPPAWADGRIVFDRAPAAAAIRELDRYLPERLVLLDPALGRRTVSGVFHIDALADAPRAIAETLGAETTALPPFVVAIH